MITGKTLKTSQFVWIPFTIIDFTLVTDIFVLKFFQVYLQQKILLITLFTNLIVIVQNTIFYEIFFKNTNLLWLNINFGIKTCLTTIVYWLNLIITQSTTVFWTLIKLLIFCTSLYPINIQYTIILKCFRIHERVLLTLDTIILCIILLTIIYLVYVW